MSKQYRFRRIFIGLFLLLAGWLALFFIKENPVAFDKLMGQSWVKSLCYVAAGENTVKESADRPVHKKGSAGKAGTIQTMENLKMYRNLSDSEKDVLYRVVSMECDTGYEGSLAVISCMLNRTESEKYSDDLMEVVRQDAQFTAYYDRETGTYPYKNRKPSKECIAAVEDALNKGIRNIPSYILYFRSSEYDYLEGYRRYGQIGDNTYFYLPEDR